MPCCLQGQGGAVSEESAQSILGLLARDRRRSRKPFSCILALFSIVSWGIILYKLGPFGAVDRQTRQFLDVFRRSNKFSEVQAVCRSLGDSPLVGLFQSGYAELTAQLRQAAPAEPAASNPRRPPRVLLSRA